MLRHRGEGQALPCVATIATDEVERLCCKNGLLFHELLRCARVDLLGLMHWIESTQSIERAIG